MDSRRIVQVLWEHDDRFVEFAKGTLGVHGPSDAWEALYGTDGISKMSPDPSAIRVPSPLKPKKLAAKQTGGAKAPAAPMPKVPGAPKAMPTGRSAPKPPTPKGGNVFKSMDFSVDRVDTDKREVFGWASIVEENGEPVVDMQGDIISPDEMEKSAYNFVLESRKGGNQHRRTEDDQVMHVSDMIESMAFTPEKKEKLGLPDHFPTGWWVGFKVRDDETWQDVKNGKITGFSIHGKGRRVPVD